MREFWKGLDFSGPQYIEVVSEVSQGLVNAHFKDSLPTGGLVGYMQPDVACSSPFVIVDRRLSLEAGKLGLCERSVGAVFRVRSTEHFTRSAE